MNYLIILIVAISAIRYVYLEFIHEYILIISPYLQSVVSSTMLLLPVYIFVIYVSLTKKLPPILFSGTESDFWLSENEKIEFINFVNLANQEMLIAKKKHEQEKLKYQEIIDKSEIEISQATHVKNQSDYAIEAAYRRGKNENIMTKKSNYTEFNQATNLGKRLKDEVKIHSSIIINMTDKISKHRSIISSNTSKINRKIERKSNGMEYNPINHWSKLNDEMVKINATAFSILLWFVGFLFSGILQSDFIISTENLLSNITAGQLSWSNWQTLLLATFSGCIGYWLILFYFNRPLEKITPKPPVVNLENCNQF